MGEHQRMSCVVFMWGMVDEAADMELGGIIDEWDGFGLGCHKTITPQWRLRAQRKTKIHHGDTAQPSRNQKAKPTTLRRTSGQATALRHGEKPEKTSCTAETRRRGEEFNKFAQQRRNLGLVIRRKSSQRKLAADFADKR